MFRMYERCIGTKLRNDVKNNIGIVYPQMKLIVHQLLHVRACIVSVEHMRNIQKTSYDLRISGVLQRRSIC